ncbi:hypothetical protein STAFG_0642 [Streptomyces afghaniensis 772]|uniref:Uncharacterized protein n=1 Tax=Streptomyces afghaniensis 772 TaxID=1283301 RepID=S4NUV3_9ACTN|nr:hypothetical protein STAFG_0642 [Streptomyces afghaniensis 772]
MKNGYTTHAGNTFTGAAKRAGRTLLVTVMHPADSADAVYEEAAALLDWGFAHGASARAVGTLVEPVSAGQGAEPAPGRGGAAAGTVVHGPSAGRLVEGAGTAVALLAGGAWALRRRVARRPAKGRHRE